MWYTALFFRCCCESAFCFALHMAEVRWHRFKHDTNMTHAHWSVNLPGPSKQQRNNWSSDDRSGRKFLQAPILCQDLGSQDRGPRLGPNSISSAPDAVGHAWARTHARENARQNARKNVRIYEYIYIPSPTIHAKKARCDLKHRVCKTKPGFVKTTMYPIQSTKSASSDGFGQNTGFLKKTPGFVDDHGATLGLYSNTSFFTGLVA
jgi:hypothetical protein